MNKRQRPKTANGIRVYWINSGSNTVGSDIATSFDKDDAWFADGSHNPIEETYLTAKQARKAERLPEPVPKIRTAAIKAALLASKAIEVIENALESQRARK